MPSAYEITINVTNVDVEGGRDGINDQLGVLSVVLETLWLANNATETHAKHAFKDGHKH
jgi:hypothetical protein